MSPKPAIEVSGLTFAFDGAREPVFQSLDLQVPAGSRTLLLGANGVGKSTLMRLCAGKHILPPEKLRVFGHSPYHDFQFSQRISFVDGHFPFHVDVEVGELLDRYRQGVDEQREAELIEVLEIDRHWSLRTVSDGQRRRVDLLLSLRQPADLLLLDEVTTQLDVVARADFLHWLKRTNEKSGMTVVYTTHILDGLMRSGAEPWPTHLLLLRFAGPPRYLSVGEKPLFEFVEELLRADIVHRKKG